MHGSAIKGAFRADSDIDCALLLDPGSPPMNARELMQLSGELSAEVGRPVDLGPLDFSRLIYFVEAVSQGERIYCREEPLANALVSRAYSYYARLREDRKEVEEAYHAA